ncbi:hypothetical protein EV363DRAFT_1151535 [Boletus edulis]|nr:hypothetical protein EV363DRAFT_1151535 [Boletus edulis]
MSTRAKVTLAASCAISVFIIWGVHYQQVKERDACDMFQGVLRDDERRREKMWQRQQDFEESQRKRALYARTQTVVSDE